MTSRSGAGGGAIAHARCLGFEPHADFSAAAGHLGGPWEPAESLLAEFGEEHGPSFLDGGELSFELPALAVEPGQLGSRLPLSQVPVSVQRLDEIFYLAA